VASQCVAADVPAFLAIGPPIRRPHPCAPFQALPRAHMLPTASTVLVTGPSPQPRSRVGVAGRGRRDQRHLRTGEQTAVPVRAGCSTGCFLAPTERPAAAMCREPVTHVTDVTLCSPIRGGERMYVFSALYRGAATVTTVTTLTRATTGSRTL